LGDVANFSKGTGYSKSDLNDLKETGSPIILYGRLYTNYETIIRNVDTFVAPKDGSVVSKGGEVIVPGSGETAEDISIASVVEPAGIILGGDLNIIFPKNNLDPAFLAINISNGKPHIEMARRAQGKSIVHLHNTDLKHILLKTPNLSEQERISDIFESLDRTITLHEEKKRQLERLKSALLQKMFADKSGYPPVRFNGFDEMWEYCKLEEVFVERNQKEVADANYPLCSFIAHKGVVPKDKYDRSFLVKSDGKKYKRTEINDFIYSSNNLETGSIGLNKFGRATISPVYSIFMVKGDSDFIAGLASTPQFIYEMIRFRQGVVYGQWRIHESDFLKIKYYIPQVTEQEKIGNLLSKLTHAIILHERKLKLLLRVKQSLLQKMFI
jgi:type I restriction enzyme S subunit